mgnify:CR=1 FL=1
MEPNGNGKQSVLPPMPFSDPESLARGHFDNFYLRSSREFWKDASIEYIKDEEPKRCEHYFISKNGEAICKVCHMGFIMNRGLIVLDGKLLYKEKEIIFLK